MILIPEIETVVILTPRTGTKALRKAIAARYPQSMMIYRHMEADGVPAGYDRWRRLGVVREPLSRLWSLYNFVRDFGGTPDGAGKWEPEYVARQKAAVLRPFEEWLVGNELPFTGPYDSAVGNTFYPGFTVLHRLPENRKSQFIYLRPDLGTQCIPYDDVGRLHQMLDVAPPRINGARYESPLPDLTSVGRDHLSRWFGWDTEAAVGL